MAGLSKESKSLVRILKVIITKQFKTELEIIIEEMLEKDTININLETEVKDLKDKKHN